MNISQIENKELSMRIYNACMDAGFSDCGIISIEDMEDYISKVGQRIERVPSSAGFYQDAIKITQQIKTVFPWAESIVVCPGWESFAIQRSCKGCTQKGFSFPATAIKQVPNINKS